MTILGYENLRDRVVSVAEREDQIATGSPAARAAKTAGLYALIAGIWITVTDWVVAAKMTGTESVLLIGTLKGWGFVVVTALVLFLLLRHQWGVDARRIRQLEDQRAELHYLNQLRETVIESAHVWINSLDTDARITLWNNAAEKITGYSREEVLGNNRIWEWLYPDTEYRHLINVAASGIIAQGRELEEFETTIRSKAGEDKIIAWHSRRIHDENGRVAGAVAFGRDVTARRQAEQALVEREQQLATLMANIPGMAYRCLNDDCWTMKFVSNGCEALTGYQPDEVVDNRLVTWISLTHPDDLEHLANTVAMALAAGEPFAVEYRLRHRNGNEVWCWEQGRAVQVDGEEYLEGIIMDITDRKCMEQDLEQLASYDQLTGLLNRRQFNRYLHDEVARASRYSRSFCLLWLDLNDFKNINDGYGHLAGDSALRQVSQLIRDSLRSVDVIARYGGDELTVILPEMRLDQAMETAERLRGLVASTAFDLGDGQNIALTVSIGVAEFPRHGETMEALCNAADRAMYRAKSGSGGCPCSADALSPVSS